MSTLETSKSYLRLLKTIYDTKIFLILIYYSYLTNNPTQVLLTELNETLHTGRTLKNITHIFFCTGHNSFLRVKTIP